MTTFLLGVYTLSILLNLLLVYVDIKNGVGELYGFNFDTFLVLLAVVIPVVNTVLPAYYIYTELTDLKD